MLLQWTRVAVEFTAVRQVAGVWAQWSEWSGCSMTCGPGTRYRYRECVAAEGDREPAATQDGYQCGGKDADYVVCVERVTNMKTVVMFDTKTHTRLFKPRER
jgi:hypothetical protein